MDLLQLNLNESFKHSPRGGNGKGGQKQSKERERVVCCQWSEDP
jgi:hypothetical protein